MRSLVFLLVIPLLCEAAQEVLKVSLTKPTGFDEFKAIEQSPADKDGKRTPTDKITFCSGNFMIKCYRHHIVNPVSQLEVGLAYGWSDSGESITAKAIATISETTACSKNTQPPAADEEKAFLFMETCDIEAVNYKEGKVEAKLGDGKWMYCEGSKCENKDLAQLPTMSWTLSS